ncbi:hypothetical protein [Agromyces lapidis]|uniref:Uncharacterized protein n=1 Tax=Agromyces lapidis TaxID=279574 RepID=A0ABV5SMA8_9MICO|nr:hypothetical protein [Agromyces lapidis]
MTGVVLGGSEWFQGRFGTVADEVAEALVRAGRNAHETAADSKAASKLRTDEPYGATFWQILALSTVEELSGIQGVQTTKPKGSRFELPVVNGTILYAAKCASQSGPQADRLMIRWSNFRERLFDNVERPDAMHLPLPEWEPETSRIETPSSAANAVILVAYVASDRGGLERIYIGDGYLDAEGHVHWVYYEELSVGPAEMGTGVTSAEQAGRFDDAPMPDLDMGLYVDDDAAEGGR